MVEDRMHAILTSLGTHGDVLPFVGLGVALRARGHRVTLVAAGEYSDLAATHWLEFRQLVSPEAMQELLGNPDFWHPIKTAGLSSRWGTRQVQRQYELLSAVAADANSVLISNPAVFAAGMIHEKLARPLVTVVLQPWMLPSASAPPIMPVPGLPLWTPRFVHSLLFKLANLAAGFLAGRDLNRVRRAAGLEPMRNILRNWFSKQLVLGMFPDWFGPAQVDWPARVQLTGFPLFDGAGNKSLAPRLLEFLGKTTPTVLFTFGSGMMHGPQLFEAASRVCAKLKVQGVFINRFQHPSPPAHMFHTSFAPFREIFPRCAAIVHHGGIGTTAEALAAGKPQLILPLGFDQLDNGVRVKRIGAGLHTASRNNFVARTRPVRERDICEIADKISTLLQPTSQAAAGAYMNRVRGGDALEKAACAVEMLVAAG
jgi:UDP:flavonoid glycosyltransferase YjiC (YdhE family)